MRLTIWVLGHQVLTVELVRHDTHQVLAEAIAGLLPEPDEADEPSALRWPPEREDGGRAIYTGEMFTFECPDDTSEISSPPTDP